MERRFLVVRLSSLGDLVLISPVLDYLSKKGKVILLTYRTFSQLYEDDPRVHELLKLSPHPTLKEILKMSEKIKRLDVEVMFDLQVKFSTLLLSHLLKPIPTVRTEKRSLRRRLHVLFGLPLRYIYVPDLHLKAVASYFGEEAPRIRPSLKPKPSPFTLEKPYVVLSPEASSQLKEWPFDRFSELAERIEKRGYKVVWVGKRKEPKTYVGTDLRGETDIGGLTGVISGAEALVGNDSAAVHIAYALNVPAVVILGPTVVNFGFIPKSPKVKVAQRNLKCRPCSTNGSGRCMVGGRPCMDIDVEYVESLLLSTLQSRPW